VKTHGYIGVGQDFRQSFVLKMPMSTENQMINGRRHEHRQQDNAILLVWTCV